MALSSAPLRMLAIDVGFGTQDILLYEQGQRPDNNIKMVLPSQTQILAKKVAAGKGDLFLYGETMGGGPLTGAIKQRIKRGDRVMMTPRAAMTIRDNPEQVKKMGVEITKDAPDIECEKIETQDVDFNMIKNVLLSAGEKFDFDCIGIAVQDHGYEPEKSDRTFRFEKIREALESGTNVHGFLYDNPPEYFARMNGALRTVKKVFDGRAFVMDTKLAAIGGGIYGVKERPVLSIDVGNGHTTAAIVGKGDEILGMVEHHTGMLTAEKLEKLIEMFTKRNLTNKEVHSDGGHGCYVREPVDVKRIRVTGPKRGLLSKSHLKIEFAMPFGDVMMAGPAGMVGAVSRHYVNP